MIKTTNRDTADYFVQEQNYEFKDTSGRDTFIGYAVVHSDREVIKVKKSIYYYLNCNEEI